MKSIALRVLVVSFVAVLAAPAAFPQCTTPFASQPSPPSTDDVLIEDSLPAGATVSNGSVNWDTSQYATGTQSFYHSGAGTNTLRIDDLNEYMQFDGKAVLYVLIDPCSTTREIKVTYSSLHRTASVYWGENLISGSAVNFRRGNLPSTGTWTRLEIPIQTPLGLSGHTLDWLQIETYDGRVWFDHLGQNNLGCTPSVASAPSFETGDTLWVDDSVPLGASLYFGYWDNEQEASGTQSLMYPYYNQQATSLVSVNDLNENTSSGDNLILYVMPTSCKELKELKITWYSGSTQGSVYYGTVGVPAIGGEDQAVHMGTTLPANNTWNRIEIPASLVGLDGLTITRVKVENIGGKVWVDAIGKQTP